MAARPDDADEPVEEPVLGEPVEESPRPEQPRDQPELPPSAAQRSPDSAQQSPADVETQWADIVARLGDVELAADSGAAPGRAPSGPNRPEARRRTDDVNDPQPGPMIRPAHRVDDPRSWLPDPVLEEAEDHFEPPDPGPVLGGDPLLTMAWGVVIGIPVLLIVAAVVWRDVPAVLLATAGALLVAAVGLLLWRMPHGNDEDDGPGPGAVV